jgi:hypothetical protein
MFITVLIYSTSIKISSRGKRKERKKNLILLEHIENCPVSMSTYLLHFIHNFEQGLEKYFERK